MPRTGTFQILAAVLTLLGFAAIRFELLDAGGGKTTPQLGHPIGHAFTDEDRAKIRKLALVHLAAENKGDVVATLHISSHAPREGKETAESLQKHEAQTLVFKW